jgi:hypothetical protein
MASPTSFPWVNFRGEPISSISTTPTLIIGSVNTCIFDSIWICNTSNQDITITSYTLVIDQYPPIYFRNSHPITNNSSQDILNTSIVNGIPLYAPSTIILNPTDLFYIYSNESGTTFDCTFSGRKLLELSADPQPYIRKNTSVDKSPSQKYFEELEESIQQKKIRKLERFHEYLIKNPDAIKRII